MASANPSASIPAPASVRSVYLDQALRPASDRYRSQLLVQFNPTISSEDLRSAIRCLSRSVTAFRVALHAGDQLPKFVDGDNAELPLTEINTDVTVEQLFANPRDCGHLDDFLHRPMDLAHAPLARSAIVRHCEGARSLALDIHHAIADRFSCHVLLAQLDAALSGGSFPEGAPFPVLMRRDDLLSIERLPDDQVPAETTLAEDRHGEKGVDAAHLRSTFSDSVWSALNALAANGNVTIAALLRTAFEVLLRRVAGAPVPVWAPLQLRREPRDFFTVGNASLHLCSCVDAPMDKTLLEAARLSDLQRSKRLEVRSARRTTLHQPSYGFEFRDEADQVASVISAPAPSNITRTLFIDPTEPAWDLLLAVTPPRHSAPGESILTYDAGAFSPERAEGLLSAYHRLLADFLASPDKSVGDLVLADEMQRPRSFPDADAGNIFHGCEARLDALFERIHRRWSAQPAVVWPHGSLSFAELHQAATILAQGLTRAGVARGDIVGIMLRPMYDGGRGPLYPVLLLALLRIGAVAAPIGRETSVELLGTLLDTGRCPYVITNLSNSDSGALSSYDVCQGISHALLQNAALLRRTSSDTTHLVDDVCQQRPAVLLFSSGTTGRPKPILQSSGSLFGLLRGFDAAQLLPPAPALMGANIGFDVSLADMWLPWTTGHPVIMIDCPGISAAVLRQAYSLGVRNLSLSPTLAHALVDDAPRCFDGYAAVVLTGEACSADLANRLRREFPKSRFIDLYGPTETTIWASGHPLDAPLSPPVPIGGVLAGYDIVIADSQHLTPLPACWPGEILISPAGPCLGYLRSQPPQSKAFLQLTAPGGSMRTYYRTGDIGWVDGHKLLRYIGRNDRQIQISGVRVELSGIEECLRAAAFVDNAAVVPIGGPLDLRIVAFVKLTADAPPESTAKQSLNASCRKAVPRPAVPAIFHFVSEFPRGASDKVDYSELARRAELLPRTSSDRSRPDEGTVAHDLKRLWSSLLDVEDLSLEDDFFALGGSSFQVLRLALLVEDHFKAEIPNDLLFLHTTLSAQATAISDWKARSSRSVVPPARFWEPLVELNLLRRSNDPASGTRIVGFPAWKGDVTYVPHVAKTLLPDYEYWTFRLTPKGQRAFSEERWADVATAFVDGIRRHPEDYFNVFIGYSLAGWLAWLTERALVAQGATSSVKIINLDGGFWTHHDLRTRPQTERIILTAHRRRRESMLLCARRAAMSGIPDTAARWQRAGIAPDVVYLGTAMHNDLVKEPFLTRLQPIVAQWLRDDTTGPSDITLDGDHTLGSHLYEIATGRRSFDSNELTVKIDKFINAPHRDPYADRLCILFLATQLGEFSYATDLARRLVESHPKERLALYALIALLLEQGQALEAVALSHRWRKSFPTDAHLLKRRRYGPLASLSDESAPVFEEYSAAGFDALLAYGRAKRLPGGSNLLAASEPPRLRGFVDHASPSRIAGWAQFISDPEAPVCLDISIDGRIVGQVLANRYRPDLERAGLGSGRHSFEFTPPSGLAFSAQDVQVSCSVSRAALAFSSEVKKLQAGV
jgi:acyl-coenzyme A synthetase/AMP-(fatty) acid ligase/acyl carrier protein/thioesterase domain-containing protein